MPVNVLTVASIFFPAEWVDGLKRIVGPMPTAWVPRIFEQGVLRHDASTLPLVVAVLVILALLPLGFRRMRKQFPVVELVYPLQRTMVSAGEEEVAERHEASEVAGRERLGELRAETKLLARVGTGDPDRGAAREWDQRHEADDAALCDGVLGNRRVLHWTHGGRDLVLLRGIFTAAEVARGRSGSGCERNVFLFRADLDGVPAALYNRGRIDLMRLPDTR